MDAVYQKPKSFKYSFINLSKKIKLTEFQYFVLMVKKKKYIKLRFK